MKKSLRFFFMPVVRLVLRIQLNIFLCPYQSLPFRQSGIGIRAISITATMAMIKAAIPITTVLFLLSFFFFALHISTAPTTQTTAAISAMPSVSHSHESSYMIFICSPILNGLICKFGLSSRIAVALPFSALFDAAGCIVFLRNRVCPYIFAHARTAQFASHTIMAYFSSSDNT